MQQYEPVMPKEIIVLDNASNDGVEDVVGEFRATRFIQLKENVGFAAANNIGAKSASSNFLLFLNPDTEFIEPILALLLKEMRSNSSLGMLGCKILNSDRTIQTSACAAFPTIVNQILDTNILRRLLPNLTLWGTTPLFGQELGLQKVSGILGACMFTKRDIYFRVNGFSQDYFMYAEDVDLCKKIHEAGYKVMIAPQVKIVHHGGGSTRHASANTFSFIVMHESQYRYFVKFNGFLYALLYRCSMFMMGLIRFCILFFISPVFLVLRKNIKFSYIKWSSIMLWSLGLASEAKQKGLKKAIRKLHLSESKKIEEVKTLFDQPVNYLNRRQYDIRIRTETVQSFVKGKPFSTILDIGCGDGSLSIPLLDSTRHLTLLDIAPNMLSLARSKIPEDLVSNVSFINSDFIYEKFQQASFDLVICIGVLAHVVSPFDLVAKIAKVIKPGGTLLLECTDSSHLFRRMTKLLHRLIMVYRPNMYISNSHSAKKIGQMVTGFGFQIEGYFRYSNGFPGMHRIISQKNLYKAARAIYGNTDRNRNAWLGSEFIFCYKRSNVP
jgi:GT2 family glycosyltransferase/ubiquinone/menaquinone biosynthesis C-methylase UbiE